MEKIIITRLAEKVYYGGSNVGVFQPIEIPEDLRAYFKSKYYAHFNAIFLLN